MIWSGWVGLGELTGFGPVRLLPGIWDALSVNSAITLPVGMETYAAYALHVMLSEGRPPRPTFARWSALGSLVLGAAGQVAYHLMSAARIGHAPWQITALVACLPVAVLGMGAALAHLVHEDSADPVPSSPSAAPDADAGPSGSSPTPDATPDSAPGPDSASRDRTPRTKVTARTPRPAKTGAGADTAAKVARLRAKHPDITQTEIAKRLGLSERTVRRHHHPTTDPDGHVSIPTPPITDPTTITTQTEPGDDESQAA
jgi:hypothetical protein